MALLRQFWAVLCIGLCFCLERVGPAASRRRGINTDIICFPLRGVRSPLIPHEKAAAAPCYLWIKGCILLLFQIACPPHFSFEPG
jgi:hypothetical protein